jgi:N-acetyl-alpha-D-muramate 1-phosphate uridylyltransferase
MRQDPQALMLFAAGFGTRMGHLTRTLPKPLVSVAGKPLIDHALAIADVAGITRKVVNLHYLREKLAMHLAPRNDVTLSIEEPAILETGGGLRQALPLLGPGPVMTLNTDAVWTGLNPLQQIRDAWNGETMDVLLLLLPVDKAVGHQGKGDFLMDERGRIQRANGGRGLVYLGAQVIDPAGLAGIPDKAFSLNRLWDIAIGKGRAFGIVHQGGWCDVGQPESITLAEQLLRVGENG